MKIQKLTIHNIASIEDATIDFEQHPLSDSEVFLITGKTGSGKSTILDAICLALYADTPRLDNTKMQGDVNDGSKTIKIDDPRQLMRRNTAEAWAELSFTGKNGVHYVAKWAVARAHKKVNGNVQGKDWSLKNLDNGVVLTRDDEIKAEIKEAIGLDFKQFCRTTILAQGEFTRFLNSEDNEKAAILEKITGVDIYSKIGKRVFNETGTRKYEWEVAQQKVSGTTTLSDAEIEEKKTQIRELGESYQTKKKESDTEIAKRQWLNDEASLTSERDKAQKEHLEALEKTESEDFKKIDTLVKDWNRTIEARGWLTESQKAETEKKRQIEELAKLSDEFVRLLGGQQFAENEANNINNEINDIERFLDSEKEKANVYENAQTIVGHLRTIADGRKFISKKNNDIEQEKRELKEKYQPELNNAKTNEKLAQYAFNQQDEEVNKRTNEVESLKLPELHNQLNAAKDLIAKIRTAKDRLETLSKEEQRMKDAAEKLAERLKALKEKQDQSKELENPLHDAELERNSKKEALDKQKDTVEKFAQTMRLKLHVGDTCPVCRQKIAAELPHEEELSELVAGLNKLYTDAENKYNELKDKKLGIDAEISSETKSYNRDKLAHDADTSVADATEKALTACQECGIGTIDANTAASLDELNKETLETSKKLDDQIKEGGKKEEQLKELRKVLEIKRKEWERSREATIYADNAVRDCNSRIENTGGLVKQKEGEVQTAEENAGKMLAASVWATDWKTSPTEFAAELTAAAKKFNEQTEKKLRLESDYNTSKGNWANVATAVNAIVELMPEWKGEKARRIEKVDAILEQANSVRARVATARDKRNSAQENENENSRLLYEFFQSETEINPERLNALNQYSSERIAQWNGWLTQQRNDVSSKEGAFELTKQKLAEHQQKKPALTDDDSLENLKKRIDELAEKMREIDETKGALDQELKTDEENKKRLGELIADADTKKADYQKWQRLCQLIGDANGNKFRKIAQSYVLANLLHSANKYMATLTDRYTLKVDKLGEFVILIEDAYQGFATRAASTISGGESFLVSLSLALALSDIGSSLSVDTLFIDEGFGTLSGEPLQNAVNTLRTLHSTAGRHVGIISHVEELQERIPVQIQVQQDGNNSSSQIRIVS